MTPRWKLWALILVVLALPACFQEAGEALQSTGSTAEPLTSESLQPDGDTPTPALGEPTTEPDFEITPQADSTEESTVGESSDGPTRIPLTVISQPTLNPLQVDTATPVNPDEQASVTPGQFITPASPLVPPSEDTLDTFIPAEATSSALVTPTAFGPDSGGGETGAVEDPAADTVAVDPACIYSVQPGDNLYRIALNNGTTIEQMRTANPSLTGENPVLQIGQELQLPNCSGSDAPVDTETGSIEVQQPPQPTSVPGAVESATQPATGGQETYTVRSGDTLFIIAQRLGTTVSALQQANQLADPNRLDVGQVLIIP